MKVITVDLGDRSHKIYVGRGILPKLGGRLLEHGERVYIISNPQVFGLYGERLQWGLKRSGLRGRPIIIPDGERYKNLATASKIYDALVEDRAERQSTIVALGGGVIGDIAGFVAATYLRGVGLVHVPTTLLAQVDSAIGGKVGVNHPLGKNLIGAFYQPKLVWVDVATLETLPDREFRAGLYEVIKYGIIKDEALFEKLELNMPRVLARDLTLLENIVARCCRIKAGVVASDERESGLRMMLNFGHTLGHALEAATAYRRLKHGEAVGWGMIAAVKLAVRLRVIRQRQAAERIVNLIGQVGRLPSIRAVKWADVWAAMQLDKKIRYGRLNFILPLRIGEVMAYDQVPRSLLREVFKEVAGS